MINKSIKVLLVCIIALLTTFTSFNRIEAEDNYVVSLYSDRNGLPTSDANVVMESNDGYIWIGSYGGLIRYDGTTFTNYSQNGSFGSSSIRSLKQDDDNRIWIGTNDAGVYYYENGQFTKIESDLFTSARCLGKTNDNVILVGGYDGLGYIENGSIDRIEDNNVVGKTVYSIAVDKYNRIWLSMDAGVYVIQNKLVIKYFDSKYFFKDAYSYCVSNDDEGRIYIGSTGDSIVRINFNKKGLNDGDFAVEKIYTGNIGEHNSVTVCKDGDILVGALNGLAVIRNDYLATYNEETYAKTVCNAIKDSGGNYWLASSDYGLIKYVESLFKVPYSNDGILETKATNSICVVDNKTYVAYNLGLLIYDSNHDRIENNLTRFLDGHRVRYILRDNDKLWIAAHDVGVVEYNIKNDKVKNYTNENGLLSNNVRALIKTSDGKIVAGLTNGVCFIEDGQIIKSYGADEGLENALVLCLLERKDGSILIGSDGRGIYEIKNDKVTNYSSNDGLMEGVILRMAQDNENVYVAAGGNLYCWNESGFNKLENFDKKAGSILDLVVDDSTIWIEQNSGLLQIDKKQLLSGETVPTVFHSFAQGLSGSIIANTFNYIGDDGRLYIPTAAGYSIFDFKESKEKLPQGVINYIEADDEIFYNPISVELDNDVQRINISFAALNYTNTNDCNVAYQIVGFDEKEILLDDVYSTNISYTNLAGGDYTFRLRIYSKHDPNKEYIYEVPIHKDLKFNEYKIFPIAVGLLVVSIVTAIVGFVYRARIDKINRDKEQYRSIVEDSLRTIANTIDAKDSYTNGHSTRVALYSREIAKRLGMNDEDQEQIYYKALLHDIGKIGIPDAVLNKPDKLTPEEREIIQSHVEIGGNILKDFKALEGIEDGARYHHERLDGTGYVNHIKADEIPLVARIIAVADTYDAMSTDRCYRKALLNEVCISELQKASGTQLDSTLVAFMIEMINDGSAPIKVIQAYKNKNSIK